MLHEIDSGAAKLAAGNLATEGGGAPNQIDKVMCFLCPPPPPPGVSCHV